MLNELQPIKILWGRTSIITRTPPLHDLSSVLARTGVNQLSVSVIRTALPKCIDLNHLFQVSNYFVKTANSILESVRFPGSTSTSTSLLTNSSQVRDVIRIFRGLKIASVDGRSFVLLNHSRDADMGPLVRPDRK